MKMKSKQPTPSFTHMQKLYNSNVINPGPGDDDDDALPEDM